MPTARDLATNSFTPSQIAFLDTYKDYTAFVSRLGPPRAHAPGVPAYSPAEAAEISGYRRRLTELSPDSKLTLESMRILCESKGIREFNLDNLDHVKTVLPSIAALNPPRYWSHLDIRDYEQVIRARQGLIADHNNWMENLVHGAQAGAAGHPIGRIGIVILNPFLPNILAGFSDKVSAEEIEACPAFWTSPRAYLIPRDDFSPEATRKADFYRAQYQKEEARHLRRMLREVHEDLEDLPFDVFLEVQRLFDTERGALARVSDTVPVADARFGGLQAQVDRIHREIANEAERNQAYRGLLLEFTRSQLMQGLEGDAESQAILRQFNETRLRDGIILGSAVDMALNLRFQRDIGTRREVLREEREAAHAAEGVFQNIQQIGKDVVSAAGMLARWTGSRTIAHIGRGVAVGMKAYEGFHKLGVAAGKFAKKAVEQAAGNVALADALSSEGTMNAVGGVVALMSALDMLMPKEDGLGEAIAEIQEQLSVIQDMIQGMWTEMRESFQLTWEILERMEDNNAKRFVIAKEYLERIIQDNRALRHDQAVNFASLKARLTLIHRELGDGVRDGMDAGYRQVIREIHEGDEAYLRAHYPFVVSRITDWLLVTAMNSAKTGYIEADRPGGRFKPDGIALEAMRAAAHPEKKLGLLAAIAHSIVPGIAPTPASIVSDDAWPRVSEAYDGLIRYHGITEEGSRARMVSEARTLQAKATEVRSFLAAIKSPEDGRQLFNKLLNTYVNSLRKAKERVEEVLEMERKRINREKLGHLHMTREEARLIEGRVLLKLDETLEEMDTRIRTMPREQWQAPIDWTFKVTTNEEAEGIVHRGGLAAEGVHTLLHTLHPTSFSLGDERLAVLKSFASDDPALQPTGIAIDRIPRLKAAVKFLLSFEDTPIFNLSRIYGVLTPTEGKWFLGQYSVKGSSAHHDYCIYFEHTIKIHDRVIPVVITQFGHARFPSASISDIPRNKVSLATTYHKDWDERRGYYPCEIATALTTELSLRELVEPSLEGILQEGRQRSAVALLTDEQFTEALNGIEITRLCLFAYFKLLGVELTAEQQALLISPEQVRTMLRTIEREATAVSVKSLLSCLNLSKLRLPAIPAPIAAIPVVPPANAGAGREAVPVAPALPANGGAGREPALPAAIPAAGAGREPIPAAPIADEHATTCEDLQRFIWSLVPLSIDALPLYRDMSAAETRLGVLVRDLGIMPLRAVPDAEDARAAPGVRVPAIAALEERVEALHEDNAALRARVDVLHEDNVALVARVGELTEMLRELLAAHRAPAAEARGAVPPGDGFFARRAAYPPHPPGAGGVEPGY